MHLTTNIKTKKLKFNNKTYIGFTISSVYNFESLIELIPNSFNNKGLTYFNKTELPNSILEIIEN